MKISKLIAVALGTGVVVAGCAAASQLRQLQPHSFQGADKILLPLTGALAKAGSFQRGLDIDWYAWRGEDVAGGSEQVLSYARSLHADALSVSFPFFERGNMVHGTASTPTTAEMGILLSDARLAGFSISLRPLLDESSLGQKRSRAGWKPANQRAWFRSYQKFLLPYVKVAQRYHASEFIVGTELSAFSLSPDWHGLDSSLRRYYHGTLACADNWHKMEAHGCETAVQTVDAYHPIRSGSFLAGWEHWDAKRPHGTVEAEVGIAAAAPAPQKPYILSWPGSPLDPKVQARWFTAACHAAVREHLGGIYFWSVGLGTPSAHGPTKASETTWAGGPGARAISRCYAGIERSRK